MRIIHLTDFHYTDNPKNIFDQDNIVNALIKDCKNKQKIDFIFFTGDLVFSGKKKEDFDQAKDLLLYKLAKDLTIEKDKIFICGGNHDVNRNQELQDTTDKIKEINNDSSLEDFLKRQDGKSFQESLKNIENYNNFIDSFYLENFKNSPNELPVIKELYTIHKLNFESHRIGILTINSAWRAIDSKTDKGNLLFPISILKEAINTTKKNTDFRIILMHHPISDFKDWNGSDIEDLLHNNFHLLFSGHLHKKKQSIHLCTDEGIFCCSSPATLALDGTTNGYTIIEVDIDTYEIQIENFVFNRQEQHFLHSNEKIKISIPVDEFKKESNDFRKTLRKKYLEELERANELFISYDDKENGKGFLELFSDPILKNKTQAQIADKKVDIPNIQLNDLISNNDNLVIYGKDKSGKTSILYKTFLSLLSDFTIYKIVPIYIDSKTYKSLKTLDLMKHISSYYEISMDKAKKMITTFSFRLLIDNFDPNLKVLNSTISNFLNNNLNVSFIATSEQKLATSFTLYEFDGRKYNNIYIHDISRPEVRSLAKKWPNLTDEKRDVVLDKIFGIFTQLNIPTNYWTVSLFLWIFEKNNDANFHNSFELIQLYIDNLLDRKGFALDKFSKLKFEDLKAYLGSLSKFLMINRADKGYTANYTEIVDFTSKYRNENKRFVIEVKDIIDIIIDKGILRKLHEDNYTFRLNGVFEYFIALQMSVDKVFANKIIDDDHFYLSFKNELELYAGFEKNGNEYLAKIFNRTQGLFNTLHKNYNASKIDLQLQLKVSEVYDISLPIQKLVKFQKALPIEKQDELLSEMNPLAIQKSEVKIKAYYETIEDSSENLEKSLHILARVFRNSNVQDEEQICEVLDYILDSACFLGFQIIDEVNRDDNKLNQEDLSEDHEKMILQIVTNFMPLIVQTFLYDAIAQNDLERIFKEKIEVLRKNEKNNQFKLLLLYFILIDLDINSHKNLIKDVIKIIDLVILKQTILLKLYGYLMFKCGGKPILEKFIKDQIQLQTLNINPKSDLGVLQQGMSKTSKIVNLKNIKKRYK